MDSLLCLCVWASQAVQWQRTRLTIQEMQETGLIPRLGRSPGRVNGNPLQYSFWENPMDRGVWQAIVLGVARVELY